ncbi:MAG: capsular biosynthesis protein [Verrucomicrobiota bacterium]|jgi:capsular polysaccharide export protein
MSDDFSPVRFGGPHYAVGFSPWKKPLVRGFLPESQIAFVRNLNSVPCDASLMVWGRSQDPQIQRAIESGRLASDPKVIRLEDGFLRSVGLGAGLTRPLSWVADPLGIYYDATRPSGLEDLLSTHPFPPPLLQRAAALRERVVALNLTKYNVGTQGWTRPTNASRVILVPGQVEADASLRFGSPRIRTNLELLRAVRESHPSAFLVYKPHPDVASGLRGAGAGESQTPLWSDCVLKDVSMADVLPEVDEVHLLTSLTGFEALLRGKKVVCYGLPFFAGWGLTEDREPTPRRGRSLSLDALVAATLVLYPRYLSRTTAQMVSPETALDELVAWRELERRRPRSLTSRIAAVCTRGLVSLFNRIHDQRRSRSI